MSQEALDFGRLYTVADETRKVYRWLNDAVAQVGLLQAAGACGTNHGDLRRSLDRDGRRVAVEHVLAIGAIMPRGQLAEDIASALVLPFGFEVRVPPPRLSDADLRRLYESGELTWNGAKR